MSWWCKLQIHTVVDPNISCGRIPGYQARKGLHTGTVKIDPCNFVILNSYVKVIYIYDLSKTFIFGWLKT